MSGDRHVGGAILGRILKTGARVAPMLVLMTLTGRPASCDWQNFRGARDGLADNQVLSILEDDGGVLWFGTPKGASRFDGVRWTTESDSLPNLTLLSLTQDRAGAYWFGTERGGAVRFDGTHWTRFSSPEVLPSNQVEAILEDHRGDLWFGTPAGLTRYQPGPGTWTTFTAAAGGLVHSHAWRLAEDHDFNLWIATPEGASRLDVTRTVWESFTATPGALARDSVLSLAVDVAGAVWFGTDQGAFRYANGTWAHYTQADGLVDEVVTAICPDTTGAVWFGGNLFGVSRYDGRVWRQYGKTPDGNLGHVLTMHRDRSGNLWVATAASGLYRNDGIAWHNYFSTSATCAGRNTQSAPFDYVLGSNCIQSMLLDRHADLWFATADGGAGRYDHEGRWSEFQRRDGTPIGDSLNVLFEDREGDIWFGSSGGGVARFDSARTTCVAFTRGQGLASDTVYSVFQDRRGDLWFGTATGASRYDGASWTNGLTGEGSGLGIEIRGTVEDAAGRLWFRTSDGLHQLDAARSTWRHFGAPDGLADDVVNAMVVDVAGRVVVGTPKGLSWFDDPGWTTLSSFGAPHDSVVNALFVDHSGRLWVGLGKGAAVYDGSGWTYFPRQTFPSTPILGLFEDDLHTLWLSTYAGLARFNGDTWRVYDMGDGLAANEVTGFLEDAVGHLWFASYGGLTEHEPDRVAPQTVLLSVPAALTASQDADLVFGAGYGESSDIEFSQSFDGSTDSPWSPEATWSRGGLADGRHAFSVRARDWSRNVDPTPARFAWEVDATPPGAILSFPLFGQPVRGVLDIRGSAADARFRSYRVEARPLGATRWSIPIDSSAAPAADTVLGRWDTRTAAEGDYELRLAVLDTLGLFGIAQVTVIVDNAAPWADVTTPARVSALSGGDVYTTHQEIHLYFPPRAFPDDAVVSVTAAADSLPATALPPSAVAITPAYDIAWSVGPLSKTATLEFALSDSLLASRAGPPAIYLGRGDEGWTRLGGTLDAAGRSIGAPITGPGRYAVVLDGGAGVGGTGGIAALEMTPRVFSPSGGFAGASTAISFTLARPASTTVTVFNHAGRRVRRVISGLPLGAGANLVHWDGRNDDGRVVEDGLYLVAVEALGEVQKRTVAVVR